MLKTVLRSAVAGLGAMAQNDAPTQDVIVTLKDGKALRFIQPYFFFGTKIIDERKGIVLVSYYPGVTPFGPALDKAVVKYVREDKIDAHHVKYIPWLMIEEVSNIEPPMEGFSRAEFKMNDGTVLRTNILMNTSAWIVGDTAEGGPVERYHNILVRDHGGNASIDISKIRSIRPVSANDVKSR